MGGGTPVCRDGPAILSTGSPGLSSKRICQNKIKEIEHVKDISIKKNGITVFTSKGTEVIPIIFQLSSALEIKINSISLTQPSLDDVFISYTGRELRDDSDNFNKRREHAKMKRIRA